jgi:transketolase
MRVTFVDTLIELVQQGYDVHLLTADLGFGLVEPFVEQYPERFTNVGVAEANMIGIAAGMVLNGKRVYCYSISPFVIFRTLDQVRCDLCYMKLPVTLVSAGGGVSYGMEGMTHYAIEDIAITRALPEMTVLAPADPIETKVLTEATARINGPCYLRLGGKTEPAVHAPAYIPVFGRIECIKGDGDVAIIANGTMVARSQKAVELLKSHSISSRLYSLHTLKPLDRKGIEAIAMDCDTIVVVEEHSIINGIGTAVSEVLLDIGYRGKCIKLGLPDEYPRVFGDRDWIKDHYGLSPENIANTIAAHKKL